MQDARDGAKADAGACKQGQRQPYPMRLEVSRPGLFVAQLLVGFLEGLFGAIALVAQALEFFAQVAIMCSAFFGLLFPLLAALSEFGLLAHPAPPGSRPVIPGVARAWNRADQDSEAQMSMHHQSEWGPRSELEPHDEVHILGKNSEPFWPFLDGLVLNFVRAEERAKKHSNELKTADSHYKLGYDR